MEPHFNFLAIAVAALVPLIMGMIYYHPKVAGSAWMDANGFTAESMGSGPKPILYLVSLILAFLLATFLAINVTAPGQDVAPDGHSYVTFQHGLAHGLIISITVLLPIMGTNAIFEKRSMKYVLVNWVYWAITIMIMAGILSAWR
ncbi:MAG: DUF1761 domain-containing protein [Saprospiraceae bacterium]